ncbi:MAG TPA: hypothetical protein VN408_14570 [Actinoplanes sp.]|nr:hypothetical protein [Actinoplanes sp.]
MSPTEYSPGPTDPTYSSADAPATYNDGQTIYIYPEQVWKQTFYVDDPNKTHTTIESQYGNIPNLMRLMGLNFKTIADTWDELKLSWAGDSAEAAQDLNEQLQQLQNRLWGMKLTDRKDQDVPGVIGQMCAIAAGATINYSQAENTNQQMMSDLRDRVTAEAKPDAPITNDNITDPPVLLTYGDKLPSAQ